MSELPGAEVLDRCYLTEISMGDSTFEAEILRDFFEGAPGLVEAIQGALRAGDLPSIQHATHSLKGSCRSLGANALGELCQHLELQARAGELIEGEEQLERIRESLTELESHVRSLWSL